MEDWQVARSSGVCSRCEGELTEGQEYYAVLRELDEGFERADYCLDCWDEQAVEHFCFWRSRIPVREKKQAKSLLVDDAVLISFFERLESETEPIRVRFRFVLALILMRKRRLRYERTVREDDAEIWLMRQPASDVVHRVQNPKMDDTQIAEVSGQLGVILRGGASDDLEDAFRVEAPSDEASPEGGVSDGAADEPDRKVPAGEGRTPE